MILTGINVLLNIIWILNEKKQYLAFKNNNDSYFRDFWNKLDMLNILLVFFSTYYDIDIMIK
jgi:hypothetical protein